MVIFEYLGGGKGQNPKVKGAYDSAVDLLKTYEGKVTSAYQTKFGKGDGRAYLKNLRESLETIKNSSLKDEQKLKGIMAIQNYLARPISYTANNLLVVSVEETGVKTSTVKDFDHYKTLRRQLELR